MFVIEEPLPPKKNSSKAYDKIMKCPVKAIPEGYSVWDRTILKGPMTLMQIEEMFKSEFKSTLTLLSCGAYTLYNSYMPSAKRRIHMTPEAIIEEISHEKVPNKPNYLIFEVALSLQENSDVSVSVPTIQYIMS